MAIAGCKERPTKTRFNIWNCGANGNPVKDENYPVLPVCPGGKDGEDTSIYLWFGKYILRMDNIIVRK
jgi:hypothetical protein